MYTEIKEAVTFLFNFYCKDAPRRRVALLMAEFGSLLAMKYEGTWDINNPTKGEEIRMIDLSLGAAHDKLLSTAAEMMICREILTKTPDIKLYLNPGIVYYTCSRANGPTVIWAGDVNSDNMYIPIATGSQNTPQAPKNMFSDFGKSIYLSNDAKNVTINSEIEDAGPLFLYLIDRDPLVSPSPIGKIMKQFVYHSSDYNPIPVHTFAKTRFGSSKTRPDHDNYRRLQAAAGQLHSFPVPFHRSAQFLSSCLTWRRRHHAAADASPLPYPLFAPSQLPILTPGLFQSLRNINVAVCLLSLCFHFYYKIL